MCTALIVGGGGGGGGAWGGVRGGGEVRGLTVDGIQLLDPGI